jgi:phosphate transport system substrate-binding protein
MFAGLVKSGGAVLAAAALVAVAGCGQSETQQSGPQTIRVDGSSTVFPLSEAVAQAFSTETNGRIRVTVGESGTGGGFRKFCRGEIEVQGASRPILTEEIEACHAAGVTFVEAPVAYDGLTVVVHPSNPLTSMSLAQLRQMWEPAAEGQVTRWRQVTPDGPDLPLQLYGAGTASGTFDFFTEAVVGTAKSSRTDYTPTEDDNVTVQGVVSNPGALGYFGFAYFDQNRTRLKALALDGGSGPVAPSIESIGDGSYPLARPLFIYIRAEALASPQVMQFARFFAANAGRLSTEVGYVPLPQEAYATYGQRMADRTTGTAFDGHQAVGASIADVMARPLAAQAAE